MWKVQSRGPLEYDYTRLSNHVLPVLHADAKIGDSNTTDNDALQYFWCLSKIIGSKYSATLMFSRFYSMML